MKVQVDIDTQALGFLCNATDVEKLKKALRELDGLIWCEAVYDPYNDSTRVFAKKLMPAMDTIKSVIALEEPHDQA